jgi:TRAP-type C4-dicarboxylate transport system permease large subunit
MTSWLCGVVVLTIAYMAKSGNISLEESGWSAFVAAVIVYAGLGVDTIYRLARHREVYQWQLRPLTRALIVVVCVLLVFFIAGVTNYPGLALLIVVPLLPVMLGIDRYVRRNRNGMPPVDGPEASR